MSDAEKGMLHFAALLGRHVERRNVFGLEQLRKCCEERVEDAARMGWTALAQSWQCQVDEVTAALQSLGNRA